MCVYTHTHAHTFQGEPIKLALNVVLSLAQSRLQGLRWQQFLTVLAYMKHQIFSVPSTHLMFPNKCDFFFLLLTKNIFRLWKNISNVLFYDILSIYFLFQKSHFFQQWVHFFSSVYTVLRIYFNSFLFILWHLEYGEWSVLLNSLQLNNQIHIYGTNTAPSTVLSPSQAHISKPVCLWDKTKCEQVTFEQSDTYCGRSIIAIRK